MPPNTNAHVASLMQSEVLPTNSTDHAAANVCTSASVS